jgi:copper chaperone CopZ
VPDPAFSSDLQSRRLVGAITLSAVTAPNPDLSTRSTEGAANTSVELLVKGMHCGSCVALVEETLQEQTGVTSATVDLDSARAVVGFDPSQIDVEGLTAAVAEAGYAATPAG